MSLGGALLAAAASRPNTAAAAKRRKRKMIGPKEPAGVGDPVSGPSAHGITQSFT